MILHLDKSALQPQPRFRLRLNCIAPRYRICIAYLLESWDSRGLPKNLSSFLDHQTVW
jgi:hypothetical protein